MSKQLTQEEIQDLRVYQLYRIFYTVPSGAVIELAKRLKVELQKIANETPEIYKEDWIAVEALGRVFDAVNREVEGKRNMGE